MTIVPPWVSLTAAAGLFLLASGCSDDDSCGPDGADEVGGPQCCAGGCGNSTDGWTPRVCKNSEWVCEGSIGTIEYACASPIRACEPLRACTQIVSIGEPEPDPAPELCCVGSCDGSDAVHRVCGKQGTAWECPANSIPVSRCKDYQSSCGGILATYKANGFTLP